MGIVAPSEGNPANELGHLQATLRLRSSHRFITGRRYTDVHRAGHRPIAHDSWLA